MSKVKIEGHGTGTGTFTVTTPSSNTNRTITLPDATATIATTTDVAARLPSITDNGNAKALAIDSAENVGIGVVPEAWNAALTGLQIGETGALSGGNTAWGGYLEVGSNFYRSESGFKYTTADKACLTEYDNSNGNINFKTAPSGNADASCTLTTRLQILNDGRGLSQFTAKVWCNFNGTGTAAIRDSHNVSTLTDHAQGDFTVTFSNNMGNTNYLASIDSYRGVGDTGIGGANLDNIATGSLRFETIRDSSTTINPTFCNLLIFGD